MQARNLMYDNILKGYRFNGKWEEVNCADDADLDAAIFGAAFGAWLRLRCRVLRAALWRWGSG